MKNITLENIAKVCDGVYYGPQELLQKEADGLAIDSRLIENNWIFAATKGERVDGHSFAAQVMEKGALGVVSEKKLGDDIPHVLVRDSFQALKNIAEFYRNGLRVKVIGITGSVGKTSTKEMIASVVSQKYNTLKTVGNFNNEVGVPLTLFRLREEHEAAVVEMGISDFSEMHRLSKIVKPDLCVITNIGQCHLENLHDRDGVLKAKTEIFDYMSADSPAILNGDDDKLLTISGKRDNIIFFSKEENGEIFATDIKINGILGTESTIHTPIGSYTVTIPIPGEHMVNNALAATAVGLKLSLDLNQIKKGIEQVKALPGRSHIIKTKQYIILDDCYNANPVSMKAAITLLAETKGHKCAILGSMFELGENEKELHKEMGAYLVEKKIDTLAAIGELGKNIYDGALSEAGEEVINNYYYFETVEEFLSNKEKVLQKGDIVLVKASHGMHLEQIVEQISE